MYNYIFYLIIIQNLTYINLEVTLKLNGGTHRQPDRANQYRLYHRKLPLTHNNQNHTHSRF